MQRLRQPTFEATDNDIKSFLATVEIKACDILRQMHGMMVEMN